MSYDKILERIDNWRRFYRVTQRLLAVRYYTPPVLGEVMQNDRMVQMPISMSDAIILELAWRQLKDKPKKQFIKLEYISRLAPQAIWRKLKKQGISIRNYNDHLLFSRATLDYFNRELDDNSTNRRNHRNTG